MPGCDGNMYLQVVSANTHAFGSVEHQRANIGGFQVVLANHGALRLVQLFLGKGNLHAHDVGRIEQAIGVCVQTEDGGAIRGLVGTDTFEYAHAVVQRVREHVNIGFTPGNHFTIKPD